MPSESPSTAKIRMWSDPPLTDQYGNAWRVTANGTLTIDGMYDHRTAGRVKELVYCDRLMWWLDPDNRWRRTNAPMGDWLPPEGQTTAPFDQPDAQTVRIEAGIIAVQAQIERLSSMLASALSKLQADVDELPREQVPDPRVDEILDLMKSLTRDQVAVSVRFSLPIHRHLDTETPIPMAFNIIDDVVTIIPLEFDNAGGSAAQKPAGSTDTVTVDNTANFSVVMGADGMSVEVTPTQPPTDGATGTITYVNSSISQPLTLSVVISSDPNAVSDHFVTTDATTRPLQASAAPPSTPPDQSAPPATP